MNRDFLKSRMFQGMVGIALGVVLMNSLSNPFHWFGVVLLAMGGLRFILGIKDFR